MSLLTQLRKDAAAFIADAEASIPLDAVPVAAAQPSRLVAYVVSPPDEWTLPNEAWLPPVMRGLPVFQPADDWFIPVDGDLLGATAMAPTARPRLAGGLCCDCGCPLFWTRIGAGAEPLCVECSPPPIRRMVDDLWLAVSETEIERVSDQPQWIRIAFAHLAAAESIKATKESEGF